MWLLVSFRSSLDAAGLVMWLFKLIPPQYVLALTDSSK